MIDGGRVSRRGRHSTEAHRSIQLQQEVLGGGGASAPRGGLTIQQTNHQGGSTGVQPAGLGNATCRAIRRRPSISKNLVKISLLDHKILENRVTLRENVGRRRGWNIVVHGVRGATGVLHDNQMIGR